MKNAQSGNVLFYILLAVALLAGLSYAVSQGGRSSTQGLTAERARIFATEIIEYAEALATATAQVRLRGYTEGQVSFENDIVSGYENAICTSDECKVFALAGGGVNYIAPHEEWLDQTRSSLPRYGELYFHGGTHVVNVGSENDDLIMFISYLHRDVCIAINDLLGIKPTGRAVPLEGHGPFAVNVKFTGNFVQVVDRNISGSGTTGQPDILHGQFSGCTESSGTSSTPLPETYHFFRVLLAR